MAPSTEHVEAMKAKALASLARTDGVEASEAEFVKFDGEEKYLGKHLDTGEDVSYLDTSRAGQYIILRREGEIVGIYKVNLRFGPAKARPGGVFVVDSMSVGVKRVKRPPKGLLP